MSVLIGAGDTKKSVTEIYVGVDGQPRKVKEGYVGVSGVPKLFYSAKKSLEDSSWAEISAAAKAGNAKDLWEVDDTKSFLFNGETYYVQIIGFDHDDVANKAAYGRDKAGITFQFGVANDPERAGMFSQTYHMNSSNMNVGGWEQCLMRTETMPLMKSYMPEDLQSVIVPVNKLTSEGNQSSTIVTTVDDLWLLSEVEIFGSTKYSFAGEGEQYQFYKEGNSKVRYNTSGSTAHWWERSPCSSNSTRFCFVNGNGSATYTNAGISLGVSFGFCL